MASFSALLSVLFLVAGAQSAAVPNPMAMMNSGAETGLGMANTAAGLGMGVANSGIDAAKGVAAAGLSATNSVSSRAIEELKTYNGNLQNTLSTAMKGTASVTNNLLKLDADALVQSGALIKSIAQLTGATTQQILSILGDIMKGGPIATAQYIQKALEVIAKNKRELGTKIVNKTDSLANGMRQRSFAGIEMLENMNNAIGAANKFTSALTNTNPLAASAAITPTVA